MNYYWGYVFAKIIMLIPVCIVVFLLGAVFSGAIMIVKARQICEESGGVFISGRSGSVCIKKESVKWH